MHGKTVVLYTEDRAGGRGLSASLRALDNRVVALGDCRAVAHFLEARAVDAVLFDFGLAADLAPLFAAAGGDVPFVVLADDWGAACRQIALHGYTRAQVVARTGSGRGLERFESRDVVIALEKLFTGDIFGLAKYLPGFGYELVHCDVGSDSDHRELIECVRGYLEAISDNPWLVAKMALVVDALVSNALYSAPRDEIRRSRHSTAGDRAPTELADWECPLVQFGSDGESFWFSVTDWFGTLTPASFYANLSAPAQRPSSHRGRNRLRLIDVVRCVDRLTVNLARGQRTEVIVSRRLDPDSPSPRLGRTIELYVQEPAAPAHSAPTRPQAVAPRCDTPLVRPTATRDTLVDPLGVDQLLFAQQ